MAFTDIIDNIHIHIIGQEKWLVWSIIYSVLHMLLENLIYLKSTTKLTKEIIIYNYMYIYIWLSTYIINRGRIASHSQNRGGGGQMARCLPDWQALPMECDKSDSWGLRGQLSALARGQLGLNKIIILCSEKV